MAQSVIVNRNLHIMNILFPEHKKYFQFISQKEIPMDETKEQKMIRLHTELEKKKQKLKKWAEQTLENVDKINTYINKSDENASRFVDYFTSSNEQQRIPYSIFLQQISKRQSSRQNVPNVEPEKIDKIRSLIKEKKNILEKFVKTRITPDPSKLKSSITKLTQQEKAVKKSQRIISKKRKQSEIDQVQIVSPASRKTLKIQLSSLPRGQSGKFTPIITSEKYSSKK